MDGSQKLIEENHNLIYSFMNKYHLSEDWYGDCAVGLCVAGRAYDKSKGYTFSTLAYRAMFNEMARRYRDHENRSVHAVSLNEIAQETGNEIGESIQGCENLGDAGDVIAYMEWILQPSSPTDLKIVWFALQGYSQAEIGKRVWMSQVNVSRRLAQLKKCYMRGEQFQSGKKRYDGDREAKIIRDQVISLIRTI